MNPYRQFVSALATLVRDGRQMPLGGVAPLPRPAAGADAPHVLVFSPHPDDECIIGGLALRLQREAGMRVANVAVTQGSNRARQAERWAELSAACEYLGFGLIETVRGGLERINPGTRREDPAHWQSAVGVIASIIREQQPAVVFFPHETDWNTTHVGTHYLVTDALGQQGAGFSCHVIETEFWGAMATPNLMVESSVEDLSDMLTALSFHVGEVRRNPYHLLVPAWMLDNLRRGAEIVGGQGGAAPDFTYCTLYRLGRWSGGQLKPAYDGGRNIGAGQNVAEAFATL